MKDEFEAFQAKIETAERRLERWMDEGFTDIKRRLDVTVQPQLDDHARRIKDLEIKVGVR